MHGPALSGWLLMVLCGVAGGYCLLRARRETGEERRAARAEAVMGFGMAAMAVPAVLFAPPAWAWAVYAVLFGAAALRALWFLRHGGRRPQRHLHHLHHLHHLVGSLAMVYMAVAMAPGAGGGGHAGHGAAASAGGVPLLTGVLLVYYAFYVLTSAGRLIPVAATAGASGRDGSRGALPELTPACRLTMGIAMFAMLLTL